MSGKNVDLKPGFTLVCVWQGTSMGENTPADFEKFIADTFNGVRAQYLENVLTKPDRVKGVEVPGTGGRDDLIFAIHIDDGLKFAVPRLEYGIRWLEDVYFNKSGYLYEARIKKYTK